MVEMDDGDDCSTVWLDLMLLNYALEMTKMVNFMFCVFYHNKKNRG